MENNVRVRTSLQTVDQGSSFAPWFDRSGAGIAVPQLQALIRAGYGFHVTVGSFSTPIVGGGNGTVLDADQPELVIDVPSGTALIPVRFAIQVQLPLAATDSDESEALIALDSAAVSGATSSNGTVETVYGMRSDKPVSNNCSVVSAVTTNLSAGFTHTMELARKVKIADIQGTAANAMWNDLDLVYPAAADFAPIIVGPACITFYFGGTVATSGFAQASWVELQPTLGYNLLNA